MGTLQGVAELFPISSLGHSVIFPRLMGWNVDQSDPAFLSFLVATHLATALVLLGFFWQDWQKIVRAVLRSLQQRAIRAHDTYARLGWLLVVSTIPAGVLGILFEEQLKMLFATPKAAAFFLLCNGVLLFAAEVLTRRAKSVTSEDERISRISWLQAVRIGCMQSLALLPGLSRTGATLAGGLSVGLSHEDAARYSFLLATPIIFAAAVLKIPELLISGSLNAIETTLIGSICSAIAAYFSIRFLTKYFKTRTLIPFAGYCMLAGAFTLVALR